jgi:RimJ/RimL family protein N-acetyltransferase
MFDPKRPVPNWTPPDLPPRAVIEGRYVTLEPLTRAHAVDLFEAYAEDTGGAMWEYLPIGPHATLAAYEAWVDGARLGWDPLQFAVRMQDGRLGGTLSLMRIDPRAGSAETGWLTFAPRLQRTREATEAVYRLMEWSFEAGYRRFEWKCDAGNLPSRRAAQRFGMSYEGVFRQAGVVKGRNRDTAWFAAVDSEWPALRAAFEAWLDPANFDAEGRQRQSLAALTAPILVARDPALG